MSDLITYDDKVRLKSQNVSEKYKVTASDMNEIKSVVNTNAEDVGDITTLTTTDKTSVVNAVNELETDKLETSAVVNEASTETDEVYSSSYLNDKISKKVSYVFSTTTGWKRIAQMSGLSGGVMTIQNTPSYGTFGQFTFAYATGYGKTFAKDFKVITNGHYINKVRIVSKSNATGYLEVYQALEYQRTMTFVLSPLSVGVTLLTEETTGSIPDGYSSTEYTFT